MAAADPFLRKLGHAVPIDDGRAAALDGLLGPPIAARSGTTLVGEGDPMTGGLVIRDGWAVRERLLANGGRQIISFLIPGDISHPGAVLPPRSDHAVTALGPVTLRRFAAERWTAILRDDPELHTAVWWLAAQEAAILREHVVALGRRSARARVLYMVWELSRRLALVGLDRDGSFDFPASKEVLADAVGMTARHLGRVLAQLHDDGIIRFKVGRMTILDPARLVAEADCREEHLNLEPRPYLPQAGGGVRDATAV